MFDKVGQAATVVTGVVVALEHFGDDAGIEELEALRVAAAEDSPEDVTHGLRAFVRERRIGRDRRADLAHESGFLAAGFTAIGRSRISALGSAGGAVRSWPNTQGLGVTLQDLREGRVGGQLPGKRRHLLLPYHGVF